MEIHTSTTRTRLCCLCQQYYGSGLRDHIAASDILRSRRMLLDRSAENDPGVRKGLEQFLDGIAQKRKGSDHSYQHFLSVCLFCTQFLPSIYQEDKLVDDLRHQLLSSGSTHNPSVATSRRKMSNLVIQHQLPRASLKTPQSSSVVVNTSQPPSQPQTYRLLTDDITRVLQLDASTVHNSLADQSNLMAGDAIKDLRQQERKQSTTILTARRATYDARLEAAQSNRHFRGDDQSLSSDIHHQRTEKRNLIRASASSTADGVASLYTGVVVHPTSNRRVDHLATAAASRASVVRSKHGRHFKTELKFPSIL